jgi:homogentisate 1,2-dioxygenase
MLKAKQQLEIYNKQIQELKEILQQKNLQVMEFATKPIKIDKDTQVTVKGLRFITEEKKDVCVCPYILLNREGLKDGKYYEADKDNLYFYEIGLKTGPDIKLVKITVIDTSDYGDDYEQQLSTLYPYVEQALKEIEE